MVLSKGMTVRVRGQRFQVVECVPVRRTADGTTYVLRLQSLDDPAFRIAVIAPLESVEPAEVPAPSLRAPGRLPLFRLFHYALMLESLGIGQQLVAPHLLPIRREDYQLVPAKMALALPRPRLLIADDVGLGKTIEAGLILTELHARRRANRVLIVCPASLRVQWQREMQVKFGFPFVIFDRETLAQKRRELEAGVNPWAYEPYIITSMDFLKRPDGALREVRGVRWDVVIVDEAHHLAPAGAGESDKQLTQLGQFLAEAADALLLLTATPHNGYDESMATLLRLLDPTLAPSGQPLDPRRYQRHFVRRLKGDIRNPDGSPKFVPRQPVQPIPVPLSSEEQALHERVRQYADRISALAEAADPRDRMAIKFVATILRKRAASSRAALKATLRQRLNTLQEQITEVEADRETLRRWRRGEPLTEEEQRKLETDAYANYLSAMRRLGRQLRQLEDERQQVQQLLERLEALERSAPDPKLQCLLQWLQALHQKDPTTKVLVFSEYADTVDAIADFLAANGYDGKVERAKGEMPDDEQKAAIHRFLFGDATILVATDIAGEGLNLHYTCHHLVHFELPWNPNRMEQRNGRIDRYGQTRPPVIAYLYLQGSYEDEVLARLLDKLDRKLRAEGTVTDILGCFQQERLERLLEKPRSLQEANEELNAMLQGRVPSEALRPEPPSWLEQFWQLPSSAPLTPDWRLDDFLAQAVRLAGGRWTPLSATEAQVQTPHEWLGGEPDLKPVYERLFVREPPDDPTVPTDAILHPHHPLLRAAIRWLHTLRFQPQREEVRLAYQLDDRVSEPTLFVTFLLTFRDGTGATMSLLEPVRVTRTRVSSDERSDRDAFARLLQSAGGNVAPETLECLFGDWWDDGVRRAEEQARTRAESYARLLQKDRSEQVRQRLRELEAWSEAEMKALLGDLWQQYQQRSLFGDAEEQLPPSDRKRLQQHRERVNAMRDHWERWAQILPPTVEPVGFLLVVPSDQG